MSQVWELELPAAKLVVLLALADIAEDDGSQVYPGLGRIGWKTGYGKRHVRRIVRDLEADGLIVKVAEPLVVDGIRRGTEYRIDLAAGTAKKPYVPENDRADKMSPLHIEGGQDVRGDGGQVDPPPAAARADISDTEGGHLDPSRGDTGSRLPIPIEPSIENQTAKALSSKLDGPAFNFRLDDEPIEDAVSTIFDAWCLATDRPGARLTGKTGAKRRRVIEAALADYSAADLLLAVYGWRHFPHNRGENERQTVYNDIELLLRDAAHIERFRDAERAARARGDVPAPTQQTERPSPALERLWSSIVDELAKYIPDNALRIWVDHMAPVAFSDGVLYVAGNDQMRDWVSRRFGKAINRAAADVDPDVKAVKIAAQVAA